MGHRIEPDTAGNGTIPRGFTLIELLVAVAVLAVLAVGASLAATRRGAGEDDADRFARLYAATRQQAVLAQGWRGIALDSGGSRTAQRLRGIWQITERAEPWRGRMVFQPEGPPLAGNAPGIVALPNGQTSAFSVSFSPRGERTVRCHTDGWEALQCTGG
ncbi:prepilin-type N-terminal cleavage/methylation domain-containing protein [Puniceibacterium sp. IMCC21224]|uniref:prepilin-type N-terminal cleavage/methylation domain-containing protein n=1 Tax=Puniceibacterium sp. IMCC21224 TaxID=1618204 RepID=UPI00064DE759|nr:prepilin-type N-terminal cleavage/methylation domain-containing protein [Puniceibacterium sp. IMCC21224]KMK64004.1 prepilin-type N-terminal cleavage/methylation domain-containing protein [Puniceibacterium sp. IMCC21224]